MNDHIEYIYDGRHWVRGKDPNDRLTLDGIVETVLCFIATAVCLVAVMMLWLCG
jgi:hypothetical protein